MTDAASAPIEFWLGLEGDVASAGAELAQASRARRGSATPAMLAFLERPDAQSALDAAASSDELDEKRSWIWIAASMGDAMAANDLIGHLETARAASAATDSRYDAACMHWTERLILDPALETAVHPAAPSPAASADGSVVVLSTIGSPQSRDGAGLAQQYGALVGTPLPRSGRLPERGEVLKELRDKWPWASDAAIEFESAFSLLRQSTRAGGPSLPPVLLVGGPGTGKTSMARRIAEISGMHAVVLPLGGVQDGAGLSETTRGYATARPSVVAETMLQEGVCNPLFVLDEIDKAVPGQNGNVHATLLSLVGATDYFDRCLLARVDVSATSFVATANDTASIPAPLLERFTVVRFGSPGPEHLSVLEASARADFARRHSYPEPALPVPTGHARRLLGRVLASKGSARAYAQAYDRIVKAMLMESETAHAPALLN